jgi:hypothetical protein
VLKLYNGHIPTPLVQIGLDKIKKEIQEQRRLIIISKIGSFAVASNDLKLVGNKKLGGSRC